MLQAANILLKMIGCCFWNFPVYWKSGKLKNNQYKEQFWIDFQFKSVLCETVFILLQNVFLKIKHIIETNLI